MKIQETTTHLKVTIAYALKDQFRSTFKTAKWDSYSKTWDIANNTANKNKLAKFQAVLDSSNAEDIVTLNTEVEMTENEVKKLNEELKALVDGLASAETLHSKQNTLKAKLQALAPKIAQATAELQAENKALAEVKEGNEKQLNAILANYNYQGMTVQEAIEEGKKYFNYIQAGYRGNNVEKFEEIKKFLNETFYSVRDKFDIEFEVVYQCSVANKNRKDRDYIWFERDLLDPKYVVFEG
ncbi:hypothetical protein [Burkholderia cenocepacia]|uniref:hypothetical protein n=1 Tax=Burkholderia cenocepacia TaxID=95486 RepID=UPI001177ACEB|nr:hypothetical protein [Burkholderia cenocepacia]